MSKSLTEPKFWEYVDFWVVGNTLYLSDRKPTTAQVQEYLRQAIKEIKEQHGHVVIHQIQGVDAAFIPGDPPVLGVRDAQWLHSLIDNDCEGVTVIQAPVFSQKEGGQI